METKETKYTIGMGDKPINIKIKVEHEGLNLGLFGFFIALGIIVAASIMKG